MTDGAWLTLTDAADACRVGRKTIRRRLDAGLLPNARRRDGAAGPETGPWEIPATDLIAAGFALHTPDEPAPVPELEPGSVPMVTVPLVELDRMRTAVADAAHRAEMAELRAEMAQAVADERAAALDDARRALRALTAAEPEKRPSEPSDAVPAPITHPDPRSGLAARTRKWFGR